MLKQLQEYSEYRNRMWEIDNRRLNDLFEEVKNDKGENRDFLQKKLIWKYTE